MAPWFSIVLPVYNVKAYLERCVRSILSQNFAEYEIILVDDGSTDGCADLCDRFARQHSCIRVIHKENGGLSSARNAGMETAQGQYIWFVDSDDWIEPGALSFLHQAVAEKNPEIVKFNYYRVENSNSVPINSNAKPGMYSGDSTCVLLQQACCTAGRFILSAWSNLYQRAFLQKKKLQFISERIVGSEDYLFNLEAYLMAQSILVIDNRLYSYELRAGSLSQSYKRDLPERYTDLYNRLRRYYGQAGMLSRYEGWLSAFYLWHLLRGTCIPNEYSHRSQQMLRAGRKNISAFLKSKECKRASAICDKKTFSAKQRLQLLAMRWGVEPLFYWLYVVKPKKKKGFCNENQT